MENCCGLSADGAKVMAGRNIGFISFFQAANYDHITFTQYLIYREALAAKKTSTKIERCALGCC